MSLVAISSVGALCSRRLAVGPQAQQAHPYSTLFFGQGVAVKLGPVACAQPQKKIFASERLMMRKSIGANQTWRGRAMHHVNPRGVVPAGNSSVWATIVKAC